MKKIAVVFLVFALLMMFAKVEFGNAVLRLDQQQTSVNEDAVMGIGGASEQIIAQVVTAGMEGVLTEVWLDLGSPDELTVEIQGVLVDGSPNDVVVTSEVMPQGSLPTGCPNDPPLSVHVVFSNPVYLMAGEQFAIVIRSEGEGGAAFSPADNPNPYAGGAFFFDSSPNAPGVWVIEEDLDLVFQTYMETTRQPRFTYTFGAIGEGDKTTGTTFNRGTMQITRDRLGVNFDFGKPWGNGASLKEEDNVINVDPSSEQFLTGHGTQEMITTYATGTFDIFVKFSMKGFGSYVYEGPDFTATLPIYGSVTITAGDTLVGILLEGSSTGVGFVGDTKVMLTETFNGVIVWDSENPANPYPYTVASASGICTIPGGSM